jgi:hypothetical protein
MQDSHADMSEKEFEAKPVSCKSLVHKRLFRKFLLAKTVSRGKDRGQESGEGELSQKRVFPVFYKHGSVSLPTFLL